MKNYLIFGSLAATAVGLIMACAPINEDQCRAGNWSALGVRDGQNGASTSQFAKYQEECAQFGVAPNQTEWLQGREEGLKTYCTPHSAYETGKRGRKLNNVCPNMDALLVPNKTGLRYDDIDDRIDELDDRADEIEKRIRRDFSGELTIEQLRIRRDYLRLLNEIEDSIDDLKREQRRLRVY